MVAHGQGVSLLRGARPHQYVVCYLIAKSAVDVERPNVLGYALERYVGLVDGKCCQGQSGSPKASCKVVADHMSGWREGQGLQSAVAYITEHAFAVAR
jgi:hypothetical protein